MADLLGDDVFGDPNKVNAAPSTDTSDVFASAVSTQEVSTPVPVPVPGNAVKTTLKKTKSF